MIIAFNQYTHPRQFHQLQNLQAVSVELIMRTFVLSSLPLLANMCVVLMDILYMRTYFLTNPWLYTSCPVTASRLEYKSFTAMRTGGRFVR